MSEEVHLLVESYLPDCRFMVKWIGPCVCDESEAGIFANDVVEGVVIDMERPGLERRQIRPRWKEELTRAPIPVSPK
jgi:hypothetical protein